MTPRTSLSRRGEALFPSPTPEEVESDADPRPFGDRGAHEILLGGDLELHEAACLGDLGGEPRDARLGLLEHLVGALPGLPPRSRRAPQRRLRR